MHPLRRFNNRAAVVMVAAVCAGPAGAADTAYPAKPIRMIIANVAGGTSGQADVLFNGMLATLPYVKGGKFRAETRRILLTPDVKEKLAGQGADPLGTTSAEAAEFMRRERERMVKLISASAGQYR